MLGSYFKDRRQAGEMLAAELIDKYRYEDCAVVALSLGGVLVAEPIAEELHAILTMLVTEDIKLPGDSLVVGSVSQDGNMVYDNSLSSFEIQEYTSEFMNYLNEQRRQAFQKINRIVGDGGAFNKTLLQNRVIILVADGLSNGAIIGAAMDYLKPIKVKKLVVALPLATVPVVDFVHITADEVHILDVKTNFMGVDHYYDDNDIPDNDEVMTRLNESVLKWKQNTVENNSVKTYNNNNI